MSLYKIRIANAWEELSVGRNGPTPQSTNFVWGLFLYFKKRGQNRIQVEGITDLNTLLKRAHSLLQVPPHTALWKSTRYAPSPRPSSTWISLP